MLVATSRAGRAARAPSGVHVCRIRSGAGSTRSTPGPAGVNIPRVLYAHRVVHNGFYGPPGVRRSGVVVKRRAIKTPKFMGCRGATRAVVSGCISAARSLISRNGRTVTPVGRVKPGDHMRKAQRSLAPPAERTRPMPLGSPHSTSVPARRRRPSARCIPPCRSSRAWRQQAGIKLPRRGSPSR